MPDNKSIHETIRARNRIRLIMSLAILFCYFGFSFGWSSLHDLFGSGIDQQAVPVGIFLFFGLVGMFLLFEIVYLIMLYRIPSLNSELQTGRQDGH